MPSITLPSDATLKSSAMVKLHARYGQLLPVAAPTYPMFFLDMSEQMMLDALEQWRSENPEESARLYSDNLRLPYSERVPFQLSQQGLEFNPAWGAFVPLAARSEQARVQNLPEHIVQMFANEQLDWDMRCSSVTPHTSLVAMCLFAVGRSNGALPGLDMETNPISQDLVLKGMKKRDITPQQLRDFTDGGLSLLDLATRYQCWDLAKWLWKKGVRFSPGEMEKGQPLLDLAMAYDRCAKAVRGFASPDYILHTRLPASQWFQQWFDRWETSGGQVPTQPRLDWAGRFLQARGFISKSEDHPSVTPQQVFASRAIITSPGSKALPLERAQPEHVACLQAWTGLLARHGVDLLQLDFKEITASANDPMTLEGRLTSYVDGTPWRDLIQAQISMVGLQSTTPQSTGPAGSPSPRI